MLKREEVIKRFMFGMSVLEAYINYTGSLNMQDINVIGENFICDLMNLLYEFNLKNANTIYRNNKGYDLIDGSEKIIVQITSTDTTSKASHTIKMVKKAQDEYTETKNELRYLIEKRSAENPTVEYDVEKENALKKRLTQLVNLKEYTLYIFVLRGSADLMRKYEKKDDEGNDTEWVLFDSEKNILAFDTLIKKVNDLSQSEDDRMNKLEVFMKENSALFNIPNLTESLQNKVNAVIDEYAKNFTDRLFRHRYEPESKVTLDHLYVDPKITYEGETSRDLIRALGVFLWNEVKNRILFIEGDAAIGKTSLVSYLCYHYLARDDIGKAVFLGNSMICIRLRELDFSDRKKSIQQIIQEYLQITDFKKFKEEYSESVLLLDGADEISMIEGWGNSGLEELLLTIRKIFGDNKIIITTRPKFIDMEKFESRYFNIKVLKLLHFDKDMREEWLDKYQECNEVVAESTREYILNIDEDTAAGVADTPLALYLLADCTIREELQGNVWALYHEIFDKAIIYTEYNENFEGNQEHPIREYKERLLSVISRIAFEMYKNSEEERYYITSKELDTIIQELDADEKNSEWIRKCCVLCAYWKSNENKGALEFYHNNIRDYFMGEYLYGKIDKLLEDDSEEGIKTIMRVACYLLSYGEIAETTWEQVYLFLYKKIRCLMEDGKRVYDDKKVKKCLYGIYSGILSSNTTVWSYAYDSDSYQHIKYVITNILLLVRIYQEALYEDDDIENSFWTSEKERWKIYSSHILSDLGDIFGRKIQISKEKEITIGQRCNLQGCSFRGKIWEDVHFSNSILDEAIFSNTKLSVVIFCNCSLAKTNFYGVEMKKVIFINTILKDVDFTNANLEDCRFIKGTTIISGKFDNCTMKNCEFSDAKLEKIDWKHSKIKGGVWSEIICTGSDIRKMWLRDAKIIQCKFEHCHMEKENMEKATVQSTIFFDCFLNESKISRGNLQKCIVENTSCEKVILSNAEVRSCEICNSKFNAAVFTQAQIRENRWKNSIFTNADFRRTVIYEDDYAMLKQLKANLTWATVVKS